MTMNTVCQMNKLLALPTKELNVCRCEFAGGATKGSGYGFKDIGQRPSPNDAVIGKDQHAGDGARPADDLPPLRGVGFIG